MRICASEGDAQHQTRNLEPQAPLCRVPHQLSRHCEEQSDEAIHLSASGAMDCFVSLAMTAERPKHTPAFPWRVSPELCKSFCAPIIAQKSKTRPAITSTRRTLPRPPHSVPDVRDDGQRPSSRDGIAGFLELIWVGGKEQYFLGRAGQGKSP